MRVCGLKLAPRQNQLPVVKVTPYAGVWIETANCVAPLISDSVTPYAGVWIETCHPQLNKS